MNLCKCGCGNECKRTYCSGHNRKGIKRSLESIQRFKEKRKGYKQSKETKIKISLKRKERFKNGYKVLRFWEHEINTNIDNCLSKILEIGGFNINEEYKKAI
jgi:hypothetical protein